MNFSSDNSAGVAPQIMNALAEANTVQFSDGTLFTAFQAVKVDDRGRVQPYIAGCHWTRNYRGTFTPRLPIPPRQKKINSKKADP